MDSRPVVLSIAGYDPSSGAGITADVKTAAALGCYAVTCITALTVQSTQGVFGMEPLPARTGSPDAVPAGRRRRICNGASGLECSASGKVAGVVVDFLRHAKPPNVVLDPVLRSSSGANLIDAAGLAVIRDQLLPLCHVDNPECGRGRGAGRYGAGAFSLPILEVPFPNSRDLAAKLHDVGCRGDVTPAVIWVRPMTTGASG